MAIIRPSILNINKPVGLTSRDVLNRLQRIYNYNHFGHAGTLDPLASGVLIVLVSEATKKQDYFMLLKKTYKTRIFFGVTSPTYDLEGPYTINPNLEIFETELKTKVEEYLNSILGKFNQVVPIYSSKKLNGKELYTYARKGKDVGELPAKEVELKSFKIDLLKIDSLAKESSLREALKKDFSFSLNVHNIDANTTLSEEYKKRFEFFSSNFPFVDITLKTGKGFYVRSLANDLGNFLGCGALMGSLERSAIGDYKIEDSKKLEDFELAPDLI